MNPLLIDFNVIIVFLIFAEFSNTFNVYLIDTQGRIAKLDEPIHIDAEHTSRHMRDRLEKQLAEFLLSNRHPSVHSKQILPNSKYYNTFRQDFSNLKYDASPAIYSKGRYTLNLEKFDDKNDFKNDKEYFDPEQTYRDYYNYIKDTNRLQLPFRGKKQNSNGKTRSKTHSLRKYIETSNGNNKFDSSEYVEILRDGKKYLVKRFEVVDNIAKRKKKKKIKPYSGIDSSNGWEESPNKEIEPVKDSDSSKNWEESAEKITKLIQGSDSSKSWEDSPKREIKSIKDSDNSNGYEEKPKKKTKSLFDTKKPNFSAEHDSSMTGGEVDASFSAEKKESSAEYEPDASTAYIQGNQLIQFELEDRIDDRTKRSHPTSLDGRRRLSQFMPKRFHWKPEDIKHLGYFWFNGPRGKYPEAKPL